MFRLFTPNTYPILLTCRLYPNLYLIPHSFVRTLILVSLQATAVAQALAQALCALAQRHFRLQAHTSRHYTFNSTPDVFTHTCRPQRRCLHSGASSLHARLGPLTQTAYSLLRTQAPTPRGRPAALRRLGPPRGTLQPGSPPTGRYPPSDRRAASARAWLYTRALLGSPTAPLQLPLRSSNVTVTGTSLFEPDRALRGKLLRGTIAGGER